MPTGTLHIEDNTKTRARFRGFEKEGISVRYTQYDDGLDRDIVEYLVRSFASLTSRDVVTDL